MPLHRVGLPPLAATRSSLLVNPHLDEENEKQNQHDEKRRNY
jgi:hypothetical protein